MKGLCPYVSSDAGDRFPHSLEFRYFPLSGLMKGPDTFDWSILEETLAVTQKRGMQAIIRVYLEYPGKDGIPDFVRDSGIKITTWESDDGENHTPDYEDVGLRKNLESFIRAFGAKYDGDPRLGYITAGLLGSWGEWHTYPREDLWASKETQAAILDAYEKAFQNTPVLLRYPAGEDHYANAETTSRPFGYHDDSFAWATLDTGKEDDDWYFIPSLKEAGADEIWKKHPIGGEIRPELWRQSFTAEPHLKDQGFAECVQQTHVTWLMDSGLFEDRFPLPDDRKNRALEEVGKMGYVLHVSKWAKNPSGKITITLENRGVAPWYLSWPVTIAAFSGDVIKDQNANAFQLSPIQPGEAVEKVIDSKDSWKGLELRLSVPHPMKGGKNLRFANQEQGKIWLTLGKL